MTVTGPVPVENLGFTLIHEHLFYGIDVESGENWDQAHLRTMTDMDLIYESLMKYKEVGGVTLVEQTTGGLWGRNGDVLVDQSVLRTKHVVAVKEIALRTGLNIVKGTGWYRIPFYKSYLNQIRTNELADELIRDITVGMHGTNIKAGLLGEIGVEKSASIWPVEERMLRAVARAHKQTGVTIATHAVGGPVGLDQLDILMDEGVDPNRVIMGHASTYASHEYHAEVVRRGSYIAFDTIKGDKNPMREHDLLIHILKAIKAGFINRIIFSHDVCHRSQLPGYGGTGYHYIPTIYLNLLRGRGITDEQFFQIMVDNPRRALSGEP